MVKITKHTYLFWYELMLKLRRFEERAGMLYGQQKIRGFCHLYIGEEAVAAGTISAIKETDRIITAYRDHGLAIAKGMSCNEVMAELFAKATGCTKGKGGSMHLFSKQHNFFGGHAIVGGQIPLGAGMAFADNYLQNGNITVCFFGDGAARQGSLHETFNMAMTWKLPVIFACENNGYAMGTSVGRTSNVTLISTLGQAYAMPSESVDAMQCEAVHAAVEKAAERARTGGGPSFLEMCTYRYKGHSMSDPAKYRTKEEVEAYKKLDPIETTLQAILKNKYATQAEIDAINAKIDREIDDSVAFAENSPYPDNSELFKDIYTQENYPFLME